MSHIANTRLFERLVEEGNSPEAAKYIMENSDPLFDFPDYDEPFMDFTGATTDDR